MAADRSRAAPARWTTQAPTLASPSETLAPSTPERLQPSSVSQLPSEPDTTRFIDVAAADTGGANRADFDATMGPAAAGFAGGPGVPKPGRPSSRFDDYEIIDELGRGGMGVVYRARELSTQRVVCVKMMLGGEYASPEALRRFHVETEAAAHLDHPNIVPIYRAGEVQGVPYFVMKYVEGQGLDGVPRDHFKNNPREAVELMSKICRAIHFAHARGILHRDLKPANILLDQQGEPHVTDFGLAKKIDDDAGQTRTGMIMGTPDYMSPEQATGRNDLVTVTTDVYSLGSMLFDLLTGQPPFKSATVIETLTRVTKEPARMPMMLNQRIGRDLETICLKCLEKDPNKRFRSAASLADELDRYLRGEPIESRPVGSTERLWRWCCRNPVQAALGVSLLLLLLTAAIGSTLAAYQINIRKNEAVDARLKAERAQQLADENAQIANQQRTLALDTLHSLVTNVEAKLRDRADLSDLQTDILQSALSGLQEVSRTAENSGAPIGPWVWHISGWRTFSRSWEKAKMPPSSIGRRSRSSSRCSHPVLTMTGRNGTRPYPTISWETVAWAPTWRRRASGIASRRHCENSSPCSNTRRRSLPRIGSTPSRSPRRGWADWRWLKGTRTMP